jgi:hypothetical protein
MVLMWGMISQLPVVLLLVLLGHRWGVL